MRFLLSALGVLAALVLLVVSGSMNFLFMKSLGKNEVEGLVLGGASAAADVLKALLPFWIAWAWQARRMLFVAIGSVVFLFFTAFSLLSALGFAADNRGHVAGTREGVNATYETVLRDLEAAEGKRGALPKHRPAPVIEEALNAIKQDKRWSSSKNCEDATAQASRAFCEGYFSTRAELAASIEDQRLEQQIAALKAESDKLKAQGAGQDRDPQVSIVSRLFKLDENFVRNGLVIFAALLVEVGSGLGLFLATGHSEIFRSRRVPASPAPVPEANVSPAREPRTKKARLGAGISPAVESGRGVAALTDARPMEARPVGDVEDYCLERLQPASSSVLTLPDLFGDYERWCDARGFAIARQGEFASDFERIAEAVGIRKEGARYIGVKLGALHLAAAG